MDNVQKVCHFNHQDISIATTFPIQYSSPPSPLLDIMVSSKAQMISSVYKPSTLLPPPSLPLKKKKAARVVVTVGIPTTECAALRTYRCRDHTCR
jgi:hypothetical protein